MSDLSQDQQNRWGDSLTALIKEVNLPLLKTQEITSLPSPNTHRGTWRLEFEGHHLLKARRFMSPILAQVAYRIHQSTAAPFLPNIIAHRGDAMLEQWIPGDPLTQQTCNETTLHQAGQILATLHSATPPSTNDLNFTPPTTHTYLQKITNNIHQLAQAGAITQSKAQDLLHLANQHLPHHPHHPLPHHPSPIAIVHRDLCPQNLLRDNNNNLISIDNGSLTLGHIDEDLARLWYRWPMNDPQQSAFARGYNQHRPQTNLRPTLFWAITVITSSARLHLNTQPAQVQSAINRLDQFIQNTGEQA